MPLFDYAKSDISDPDTSRAGLIGYAPRVLRLVVFSRITCSWGSVEIVSGGTACYVASFFADSPSFSR